MTQAGTTQQGGRQADDKNAIRPFHMNVPEADLTELRRRVNATKWPERETVSDASQGVQLATTQALARYWATDYDWRKIEANLSALPKFHNRDQRAGHSFHPRSFEARKRIAADRNPWMARLDHRTDEDHALPGAQARRAKVRNIGYGVRSDFELNFGRYLPSFGPAADDTMPQ
jgi:hypothetical protein